MNNTVIILSYSVLGYTPETKDYMLAASVLLNLVLAFTLYWKYYYSRTPFAGIRIRKPRRDFPDYQVKIKNTGIIPIELEPPVVVFKKHGSKRFFQVRNGNTVFPLSLFRKEEYDFIVDLAKFYTTDSSLITYNNVYLEVRDKKNHKIACKRIYIK